MARRINDYERAICLRVKAFRKAREISQEALGSIVGIAHTQVSRIEGYRSHWSVFQLATIAHHFGVPVTDFIPSLEEEQPDRSAA